MAPSTKSRRASFSLRALLGLGENARLQNRVLSLSAPSSADDERQGTPCTQCGFGRMFPAPIGENGAVRLLCERRDCRFACDRPTPDSPGTGRGRPVLAA